MLAFTKTFFFLCSESNSNIKILLILNNNNLQIQKTVLLTNIFTSSFTQKLKLNLIAIYTYEQKKYINTIKETDNNFCILYKS